MPAKSARLTRMWFEVVTNNFASIHEMGFRDDTHLDTNGGTTPGNQMIISNLWRNVTWSDAWRKTQLFSIKLTQEHEVSWKNWQSDFRFLGSDNSHRLPQCRARLQLVYPLVHMSVPSERQVPLHTDSWEHHNPEPRIQGEPSYVMFEFSNHHCRPPQSGSSKNLVPYHQIFLSWTDDFFLCPLRTRSLLSASDKLCAVFFPVTDGTTSIARRHLLQLIDGFSCAPGTASTFWVESSWLCRMLKFLSCISQTDQSFLFLANQLVPLLWTIWLWFWNPVLLVIITVSIEMEIRGLSASSRAVSRSVSCFTEIISDFLTSLDNNRLGDGLFLTCASCVCSWVMILIPEISLSVRFDALTSQPVSSDFLIEINGCVLLQSNSENFTTENVIQDAFSLALFHVEIVIQCLLSKLLKKFSTTIVFQSIGWCYSLWTATHPVCRASFSPWSSAVHAILSDTALVPICHDLPIWTQPDRALHQFPTQQTFRRYGRTIVAHAPPPCGQLHLTSPRISAPLPMWNNLTPNRRVSRSVNNRAMTKMKWKHAVFAWHKRAHSSETKTDDSRRAHEYASAWQKYVQMCIRSTPVQWRDNHNKDINKVTEETNLGSYTVQRLTSPLHDDKRATTPYLGNKVICDWPTSNVHKTLGVEIRQMQPQAMLQIPSRLPREKEIPSPDHDQWYTRVVNAAVLPLKCIVVFPAPLLLHCPLSKGMVQRNIGWPDLAKFWSIFSAVRFQNSSGLPSKVPYHFYFWTRTQERPMTARKSFCILFNCLWLFFHIIHHFLLHPTQCRLHIDMKMILWNSLVHTVILPSSVESYRRFPVKWILGKSSTRIP